MHAGADRVLIGPLGLGLILVAGIALASCGQPSSTAGAGSPAATDSGGVAPQGGDIPDNQVYLAFQGPGFSVQYPEGWVQTSSATGVIFADKDNQISVAIRSGTTPTADSVGSEVRAIAGAAVATAAHTVSLPAGSGIAVSYQVDGAADPVTGKRPRLSVDRYELGRSGQVAVVELAAPVGVDNVDAYRMIAQSFRWR
jgi:hypothetical protein